MSEATGWLAPIGDFYACTPEDQDALLVSLVSGIYKVAGDALGCHDFLLRHGWLYIDPQGYISLLAGQVVSEEQERTLADLLDACEDTVWYERVRKQLMVFGV